MWLAMVSCWRSRAARADARRVARRRNCIARSLPSAPWGGVGWDWAGGLRRFSCLESEGDV